MSSPQQRLCVLTLRYSSSGFAFLHCGTPAPLSFTLGAVSYMDGHGHGDRDFVDVRYSLMFSSKQFGSRSSIANMDGINVFCLVCG
jgi:hypothetical protein